MNHIIKFSNIVWIEDLEMPEEELDHPEVYEHDIDTETYNKFIKMNKDEQKAFCLTIMNDEVFGIDTVEDFSFELI